MREEHRELLPRYLHILFDLCIAGVTTSTTPLDPSTQEPPEKYLELANLIVTQVLMMVTDEAHLSSEEHQMFHSDGAADAVPTAGIPTQQPPRQTPRLQLRQPPCISYPYPPAELVHLATVSFNLAVELYSKSKDEDCRRWAWRAIRLAKSMNDDQGRKLASMFLRRLDDLFCG